MSKYIVKYLKRWKRFGEAAGFAKAQAPPDLPVGGRRTPCVSWSASLSASPAAIPPCRRVLRAASGSEAGRTGMLGVRENETGA